MNKRIALILFTFGFVGIILAIKLAPIFGTPLTEKYIRYNDVRGAAVDVKGELYTLNFMQQNALVAKLNEAEPVQENSHQKTLTRIILYRFNAPDLTFEADSSSKNLIFLVPEWDSRYLTTSYDLSIFNE